MTVFWILAALMTLGGLLVLAFTLLRKTAPSLDGNREQNVAIAKERMSELESQLAGGTIDAQTFEQEKLELEQTLLDDIAAADAQARATPAKYGKLGLLVAGIGVPVMAVGMYLYLGSPQYIETATTVAGASNPHAQVQNEEAPSAEELTAMLEQRIKDTPDDPDAWFMLGRMYASAGRYNDAADAYRTLARITDNHPTALVVLADVLAMSQDGKIAGQPMELVLQALELDPDNATALWLAGRGSVEVSEYAAALSYYERASVQLSDKPELLQQLDEQIQEVRVAAREAGVDLPDVPDVQLPDTVPAVAIGVAVSVDPSLQASLESSDTLFVFARATEGPPMPLAAVKGTAGDLPAAITLDDTAMLRSGDKLSQYAELTITARITRSGQPMAASGDMQSDSVTVRPGYDKSVSLVINQRIP
jgi:cytochrome c-type biogenesis protein CcmH